MTADLGPSRFKLGRHESGVGVVEHRFPDVFERRTIAGREAVVLAPSVGQVELLRALIQNLPEPFSVTYALLVPFQGFGEGRYQLRSELDRAELDRFLNRFREFFESDARHHLLIGNSNGLPRLIYDQHNLIYCFEALERVVEIARERGLQAGHVEMPSPHSHHSHDELNAEGAGLLSEYRWTRGPLEDSD